MSVQVKGSGTIGGLDEGLVVSGIVTSSTQVNVGSNIKLGNAGVVTATSFVGSGANLTSLPAQATIANNADNRVITGGSGVNLNGEANLTYNGSILHNQISAGARNDFSTSADGLIIEKGGNTGLSIDPGSSGTANIYFPNESNHSIAQISHNNSTGEFRIRGEDHVLISTNNNTERLRIDSSGRLLVGQTSAIQSIYGSPPPKFSVSTTTASPAIFATYSNNTYASRVDLIKSRNTTVGSHTVVQANDALGELYFGGSDGDQYLPGALIQSVVESGVGDNDMPADLRFFTNGGATTITERLRINSFGNMALGTVSNAGNALRYFDVGNYNTGSSAGSIIRLLTTKSDGTGAVGLDIVKYKSGGAYLNNYETLGTNGFIAFGTGTGGGSVAERLRIASDGKLSIDRTHASATTGNHPALDIDTYANGTAGATFATGIDFRVAGVHKKRMVVTNGSGTGGGDWIFYRDNGNNIGMQISSAGYVTKPNTPAFRATESGHAQTGFLTFDQIATNVGSHYNGSNGRFTVPVAGTYFFTFYGMLSSSSGNARVEYYINGSVHSSGEHYGGVAYTNGVTYNMISCSTVLTLAVNDYVNLNWNASYNSMHSYHNGFMGYLIG